MNDEYQTRQFFNMKKSELKQIIKEEIRKVLNENEPPEPVVYNNGFNLYDTKEDFEKALDYYWGKDKEDWELVDYNEKYGGGEIGDDITDFVALEFGDIVTHFNFKNHSLEDGDLIPCLRVKYDNKGYDYKYNYYAVSKESLDKIEEDGFPVRYYNFSDVSRRWDVDYLHNL